ncbi:MAG: cation:proton antiporter subunit C [Halobacteriales archaeon]|nr:cation:proton antiporter subunit C [Halobacteriales archaeon]
MTDVAEFLLTQYYHVVFVLLLGIGVYTMIDSNNLVKKVIGLNVFQVSVFLLLVSAGYLKGSEPAIIHDGGGPYVNPLPHVLILTAIVVGVSLTALALALVVRVYQEYGTLNEEHLQEVMSDD